LPDALLYNCLKLLHILFAVAAVGSNLTYGLWFARSARDGAHLDFTLRGIQALDDWVANPAYAGLGLSGPLLVWAGGWSFSLAWVWLAIVLLGATSLLGLGVYSPLLKRQIAALERDGKDSAAYRALSARGALLGGVFGVLNLLIFILMVFKPSAL
jgi:uncharacterized membrane protein